MYNYEDEVLEVFLEKQLQLFDFGLLIFKTTDKFTY